MLDEVCTRMEEACNVRIVLPEGIRDAFLPELKTRIAGCGGPYLEEVELLNPLGAIPTLWALIPDEDRTDGGTLRGLATGLSGRWFWIWADDGELEVWWDFLKDYAAILRSSEFIEDPPVFCLAGSGVEPSASESDILLRCLRWQGSLSRRDVEAYVWNVRTGTRVQHPWYHELAVSVIASLAEDDILFVEHLSRLDMPLLLDHARALDGYDGVPPEKLSMTTGTETADEWSRRIWRGQIREVFPLLEEMRLLLLAEGAAFIQPPFTIYEGSQIRTTEDPRELELGYLSRLLDGHGTLGKMAFLLKGIRDGLAHLRPTPIHKLTNPLFLSLLKRVRA
ncbi:MAG: hypothetical protein LBU64_11845 [Planctomycetota bacterium]|jgi:hypothetical protein|nr:hypothetical protein [Planctomycetota bacterium]